MALAIESRELGIYAESGIGKTPPSSLLEEVLPNTGHATRCGMARSRTCAGAHTWKYSLSQSADAIDSVVSALPGLTGLERLILILVPYALVASGLFIILFYFGTFGILCLLDILTIRLQARFAVDIALLNLKETRLGRFRHDIVVSTEKTDSDSRLPSGDFHLIVTARRGALVSALVHRGAPL